MKKILKCSLCGNSLEDSKKILIKNIPESAQGFLNEQDRISRNYSANLIQCNFCKHVQLNTKPVRYYKEVIQICWGFNRNEIIEKSNLKIFVKNILATRKN